MLAGLLSSEGVREGAVPDLCPWLVEGHLLVHTVFFLWMRHLTRSQTCQHLDLGLPSIEKVLEARSSKPKSDRLGF